MRSHRIWKTGAKVLAAWVLLLCGLCLGTGCEPPPRKLNSSITSMEVTLTPATHNRRFVVTLTSFSEKDVEWDFRKLTTGLKYTFISRDAQNVESSHVVVGFALHPESQKLTNALPCFDNNSPQTCTWQRKDIDLQKDYRWHLGHELGTPEETKEPGKRQWRFYIEVRLKSGAPVKGKLELNCEFEISGADDEELAKTNLRWAVEELILE